MEEQKNGSGSRGGSWSSLEIIMERRTVLVSGCSAIQLSSLIMMPKVFCVVSVCLCKTEIMKWIISSLHKSSIWNLFNVNIQAYVFISYEENWLLG